MHASTSSAATTAAAIAPVESVSEGFDRACVSARALSVVDLTGAIVARVVAPAGGM